MTGMVNAAVAHTVYTKYAPKSYYVVRMLYKRACSFARRIHLQYVHTYNVIFIYVYERDWCGWSTREAADRNVIIVISR